MNVLIINDEKWTADMIREDVSWEKCGIHKVFTAYDAASAREQIKQGDIQILLCDIEMPGENGIQLMHWVREHEYEIECIFFTCHANFSYAQEAVKLNCLDYILMPARAEEIEHVLTKVVTNIQQKQANRKLEQYGARWIENQKQEAYEIQGTKKNSEAVIQECLRYIHNHLEDTELSVNQLADQCHMNAIYLNRIFRKEKETSIGQYIIQERMHLAARLLLDSGLTAHTVAEKVGYLNYPYFSTAFKKFYGCSPQKYVERQEDSHENKD